MEILRRQIQFLDLGDRADHRRWVELLDEIPVSLHSDSDREGDSDSGRGPSFRLFRGDQRAIGETVIVSDGAVGSCIGYAEFCGRLDSDPDFAAWYAGLDEGIRMCAEHPVRHARLSRLQHALMDLIDFLDPAVERFPARVRDRLRAGGHGVEPYWLDGPCAGAQEGTG